MTINNDDFAIFNTDELEKQLPAVEVNAVIPSHPENDQVIVKLGEEINKIWMYAKDRTVAGPDDVKRATEDLALMANLRKALTVEQARYLKPAKDVVAAMTAAFKTWMVPLEDADQITRGKINVWRAAENKRLADIQRANELRMEAARLEAAANGGVISESVNLSPEPPAPARKVQTDVGDLGSVIHWHFEVVNADLVPREYMSVDLVKVGKVVRATKGTVAIPGIRAYSTDDLAVRPK